MTKAEMNGRTRVIERAALPREAKGEPGQGREGEAEESVGGASRGPYWTQGYQPLSIH